MLEKAIGHGYDFQRLDDVIMVRVSAATNGNAGMRRQYEISNGADLGTDPGARTG
jgi:hypothetical protein